MTNDNKQQPEDAGEPFPMDGNFHIRATGRPAVGAPHIEMLLLEVWPLPQPMVAALGLYLQACVNHFLTMNGMTEEHAVNLAAMHMEGPPQ